MRVEVDGVGIEYEVTGEGRPVVLLHGANDASSWNLADFILEENGFGPTPSISDLQAKGLSGNNWNKIGHFCFILVESESGERWVAISFFVFLSG